MSSWAWAPFITGETLAGEYQWTITGGLTFGGSAPAHRARIHVPEGGIVLDGEFSYFSATLPQEHVYVMTGGLEFGGAFVVDGRVWADWEIPETVWVDAVGFE